MQDGDFTQEAFDSAFNVRYEQIIRKKTPVQSPKAFILGGQPGAGKTGLQKMMMQSCSNNLIVINADEFRELHPEFQRLQEKYGKDSVNYTGGFSGRMTEELVKKLKDEKYNVLVEGTLRTAKVPLDTCSGFKKSGYHVTLAIMAVKPEISYLSTIMRYENMLDEGKTPRATPKQGHDNVVAKIPDNLRELHDSGQFNNILIYNREGKCLYDMSEDKGITPDTVMEKMFYGKWSQEELNQFFEIGKRTQELMEKRNAPDLSEFKTQIFNVDIVTAIAKENGISVTEEMQKFFAAEQARRTVPDITVSIYQRSVGAGNGIQSSADLSQYQKIYEMPLSNITMASTLVKRLEDIYDKFTRDIPPDYTGKPLNPGDIIALNGNGYTVEPTGFKKIGMMPGISQSLQNNPPSRSAILSGNKSAPGGTSGTPTPPTTKPPKPKRGR